MDHDSNDNVISKVLLEIAERPLFINLQHGFSNPSCIRLSEQFEGRDIEFVGSSTDGLKTARCFDVGDVDVLVYANETLTSEDEATFEYRQDNPSFLHIPLPERLSRLEPVDGKYLNARTVRQLDKSLFGLGNDRHNSAAPYTIVQQSTQRSDYKCATTSAVQWSDPVFLEKDKAPAHYIDQRLFFLWSNEHALFTFLLHKSVDENLNFVRELLYGGKLEGKNIVDVETHLKQMLALVKEDAQRLTVNINDIIHFKSETFTSLLQQAVDDYPERTSAMKPHGEYSSDVVPAIRCTSWPRPSMSFIKRDRIWPHQEVIDEIVKEGFRLVPKTALLNPVPEKDFILSFSHADVKLISLLPQEARTAYCVLKMCYKSCVDILGQGHQLKTYHLKQALLWVAEERLPDSWMKAGPLQGLRWICDFLLKVLKERWFPSYYVEDSNHICHFTEDECDRHIKLLSGIRRNPANFVKVVIDQEWELCAATMPPESVTQIQTPGYFSSFSSDQLLKIYMYTYSITGGYQIDEMYDQIGEVPTSDIFVKFVGDAFNTSPHGNAPFVLEINGSQLQHVAIFVQTVSKLGMDLFNVLDFPIDDAIRTHEARWLPDDIIQKYPQIHQESAKNFGEHVLSMLRLRLKYYGNIFHILCNMLAFAAFQSPMRTFRNHDANYIIRFLKQLISRKAFDIEQIQDLLHYLFYFCHFTRLRHHTLGITDQILRSMREFLQDSRILMTVYFNPRQVMPRPVDTGDKIQDLLGQCFL